VAQKVLDKDLLCNDVDASQVAADLQAVMLRHVIRRCPLKYAVAIFVDAAASKPTSEGHPP